MNDKTYVLLATKNILLSLSKGKINSKSTPYWITVKSLEKIVRRVTAYRNSFIHEMNFGG